MSVLALEVIHCKRTVKCKAPLIGGGKKYILTVALSSHHAFATCLCFVSSPLFDGCPSQLCLSRWSESSRRARFRRPVSGVLACVSAIKTWETVSSSNPPDCITVPELSFTLCLISEQKWINEQKTAIAWVDLWRVRRLLCPVLPPVVHL